MTFLLYNALYLGVGYLVYRLNRDYIDKMLINDKNVSTLLLTQDFIYIGLLFMFIAALVVLLWPMFLIGRLVEWIKKEVY